MWGYKGWGQHPSGKEAGKYTPPRGKSVDNRRKVFRQKSILSSYRTGESTKIERKGSRHEVFYISGEKLDRENRPRGSPHSTRSKSTIEEGNQRGPDLRSEEGSSTPGRVLFHKKSLSAADCRRRTAKGGRSISPEWGPRNGKTAPHL